MTRAVDRLVARSRRPPLPVAPDVVGPAVLDAGPFPVSPSAAIAPRDFADDRSVPARRRDGAAAQPSPPEARRDAPTRAAATPLDVALDDAAPSRTAAVTATAGAREAVPPRAEPQLEPVDRPPGTLPAEPTPLPATQLAGDGAPRRAVAAHDGHEERRPPVVTAADGDEVAVRNDRRGEADSQPPTSANPIAARLEDAAIARATPDPEAGVARPTPDEQVGPPASRAAAAQVLAEPHRTVPSHRAAPSEPATSAAASPTPSVTIGTIEVVTPPAGPAAPRPLDALATRRHSGRRRWTGRAR